MSEGGNLLRLRDTLTKLQAERDLLANDILKERESVLDIETKLNKLQLEQEYMKNSIREKETVIRDFDKMIQEAEATLGKLMDNSVRLLSTMENESNRLKTKALAKKK